MSFGIQLPENPNHWKILGGIFLIIDGFILSSLMESPKGDISFFILGGLGVICFMSGLFGLDKTQQLKDKTQQLENEKKQKEIEKLNIEINRLKLTPEEYSKLTLKGIVPPKDA